jgi:hypothetical protein
MQLPDVPHEVVLSHILPWLPVKTLIRSRCVCKAWRDAIADDGSLHRAHLRRQTSALLIAARMRTNAHRGYKSISSSSAKYSAREKPFI